MTWARRIHWFETDRLILQMPYVADGRALYEAAVESQDVFSGAALSYIPPYMHAPTLKAAKAHCRNAKHAFNECESFVYLLWDKAVGELVGSAGLHRVNWVTPSAEVGYWCRATRCGQGLITEAVTALCDLAFDELSFARLALHTDQENAPSRAVAKRCGFKLEGVLRNERRRPDGLLRNTCAYARVK